MKKTVVFIIAVLVAMTMSVTAFAEVDTYFPFLFKTANATPTIDGVKDEAYEGSDMIDIMQPGMLDLALEGHATAKVWTLWDDTNIYVYAEVNDPTPATTYSEGTDPWMLDSVEVYVDFANTKASNAYMHEQELTGQFRFCRTAEYPEVSGVGMYTDEAKDNVEFKVIDNGTDGYIVEAAIPHRDLAKKIGFSFQINDDMDADQVRDITIFTKMDGYMACQMNYAFDTLELEGCTAINGLEDDTIIYNTIDDLHELNNPTVEEPSSEEPSQEPADEPSQEAVSSENVSDVTPVDDADGSMTWIVVAVLAAAVAVVVVVIIAIIKSKKS